MMAEKGPHFQHPRDFRNKKVLDFFNTCTYMANFFNFYMDDNGSGKFNNKKVESTSVIVTYQLSEKICL